MRPSEILKQHLDYNPQGTIVASYHQDGTVMVSISTPGNLPDIVWMHKLLNTQIDKLMNAKQGEEIQRKAQAEEQAAGL